VSTNPPTTEPALLAERYELVSHLGSGGMADVYLARDTLLGRDVAIKVFRDRATEARFDERQKGEIGLLARLNHPGLVTIFDAGADAFSDGANHAFLVMELVAGPSLGDRLAKGALPREQTATIGAHVAESLAYIHEAGIVHRDVKPANILLPDAGRSTTITPWTKLTDFGIARLITDAHLTATGLLIGTPNYMSPEQAIGTSPGPPTDVYALGLVLLECMTGVRSFPGTSLESAVARLNRNPEVPADLGPAWTSVLTAMTARNLADRPTADEASRALRALTGEIEDDPATRLATPFALTLPPTGATQVLSATGAASSDDGSTRVLTAPPEGTSTPPWGSLALSDREQEPADHPAPARPGRRRTRVIVASVVIAAVVGVGLWFGLNRPDATPAPAPSYPAVTGQLGQHLKDLQRSVNP